MGASEHRRTPYSWGDDPEEIEAKRAKKKLSGLKLVSMSSLPDDSAPDLSFSDGLDLLFHALKEALTRSDAPPPDGFTAERLVADPVFDSLVRRIFGSEATASVERRPGRRYQSEGVIVIDSVLGPVERVRALSELFDSIWEEPKLEAARPIRIDVAAKQ